MAAGVDAFIAMRNAESGTVAPHTEGSMGGVLIPKEVQEFHGENGVVSGLLREIIFNGRFRPGWISAFRRKALIGKV